MAIDTALLQRDEAIDDVEVMIGPKLGLELTLKEANAEVASLRLAMPGEFTAELEASRTEVMQLLKQAADSSWSYEKVKELTANLEASKVEVTWLHEQVAELQVVEGIDDSKG
ncbi:hypothetical protein ACLOJK_028197 [Asimina triloba]